MVAVYWLRRIPAETRIVVLVSFLALLQAILLSVFGLRAIQGERRQLEEQARGYAETFLRERVAIPAQNALRERAAEAFEAAFGRADPAWASREPTPGGGLFTAAFEIAPDGRILEPGGLPLWVPLELLAREREAAAREADDLVQRFRRNEVSAAEKAGLDLEFARRHPFSEDGEGDSLGILFASTALLQEGADPATLLQARWIGVLHRVAGWRTPEEAAAFLRRVDERGVGSAAYRRGVEEQDRREAALGALRRAAARIAPKDLPSLHPGDPPFYIRSTGPGGSVQALAVAPDRLRSLLDAVAEGASGPGVLRPRIEEGASFSDPALELRDMPGRFAVARISAEVLGAPARERERFYRIIIGFSVACILAGGFVTARALMREVKLAKLKSDFVSNVSHELKTPLTSIRMFTEMLRGGKVVEEAERNECLDVIAQESERLGQLIQRVLDFSRLQARKRTFRWTVGPLAPVVEREAERFRRATGLAADRFSVGIAPDLPPVRHDPDAMAEVLSNLLGNAWKYTPASDRRIGLLLGSRAGRVAVAVEDNGPGVPPRDREKIFEEFYRGNDLLTREVEGTGLGLAIARNIVRAHGGRILVEDRPGGGSRFLVLLPAAAATEAGQ